METAEDQYRACEAGRCSHDLARAVGIADLWGGDGPFRPVVPIIGRDGIRARRFEDDEPAAIQQRWAV